MSTDRELLELAAKAAGLTLIDWSDCWEDKGPGYRYKDADGFSYVWNPLADDGDALRLAVNLHMIVEIDHYHAMANGIAEDVLEPHDGGAEAATRRAIVRAAAEIGRAMP